MPMTNAACDHGRFAAGEAYKWKSKREKTQEEEEKTHQWPTRQMHRGEIKMTNG